MRLRKQSALRAAVAIPLLAIWIALGLSPEDARATSASGKAIRTLQAHRDQSGIPGTLVEDAERSQGCRLHARYLHLNPGLPPSDSHSEDKARRGYTELGERLSGSELLMGLGRGDPWDRRDRFPWAGAPLHLWNLMAPYANRAWYGAFGDAACMGVDRLYDPAIAAADHDVFFSYPNAKTPYVYERTVVALEYPYNPAERLGLKVGRAIGPWFLLYGYCPNSSNEPLSCDPVRAHVTGPDGGSVPSRLSTDDRFLVVVDPLRTATTYSVEVAWRVPGRADEALQRFNFTTDAISGAHAPDVPPEQVADVGLPRRSKVVRGRKVIEISGRDATGQRATVLQYRYTGSGAHMTLGRVVSRTTLRLARKTRVPLSRKAGRNGVFVTVKVPAFRVRVNDPVFWRGFTTVRYGYSQSGRILRR